MQTKKRAKPVKFNTKDAPVKKEPEKTVENEEVDLSGVKASGPVHNVDKEKSGDTDSVDSKPQITAIETLDITEDVTEIVEKPEESKVEPEEVKLKNESEDTSKEPDELIEKERIEKIDEEKKDDDSPLEKDQAFFNLPPDDYENKKSNMPYFLKVMGITFLVGLVFFAGIYYAVTNKSINFIPGSKKTEEVTNAPTKEAPTLQPVNLAEFTLQVLNGTGVPGTAAKVKTSLEGEGFKVLSIGNADKDDLTLTEIAAKKKVDPRFVDKLKEVLSKTYKLGSISELASGEADVVIKIGSASAK